MDPPQGSHRLIHKTLFQNMTILLNVAYNNMLDNVLPLHLSTIPWVGSKCCFFSLLKVFMLAIKFTRMKHRIPCKQIFCPFKAGFYTPSTLWLGQNIFF